MIRSSLLMAVAGQTGYQIPYSLRFRAANNAHLARTPGSTTNRRTFTLSGWYKLGDFNSNFMWGLVTNNSGNNDYCCVRANSGNAFTMQFVGRDAVLCDVSTSAMLRDPTAWYHLVWAVDSTQATAANRVRLYINGIEQTSFSSAAYPALNTDFGMNNSVQHYIGRFFSAALYADGYMAEVHFIDGQQLTPSSFGQTDATTGAWVPRRYTGTYGTNGFYLPFNDAASTTTISQDRSGNGNNWTSSGISVTSGATFDQMTDTPTNNFPTLTPLDVGSTVTLANANLSATSSTGGLDPYPVVNSTQALPLTGKYYWEYTVGTVGALTQNIGIVSASVYRRARENNTTNLLGFFADEYTYRTNGTKINNNVSVAYGATLAAADVVGVAFDTVNLTLEFYKNGVSQGVAYTVSSGQYRPAFQVWGAANNAINFGQRAFAFTPPTGYVGLCTANLSTPTIQNGASAFQATLRTGTGASASVSSLAFQPDLVWIKSRSNATNHNLFDAVRGVNNGLVSNSTAAEYADANSLTAFSANGYTLGTDGSSRGVNINTNTYVDWAWREGAAYGFDIVTYTGNAVAGTTIAHALGAVPHLAIVKSRTLATNWYVYHRNLSSAAYQLFLNLANAQDNAVTTAFNGKAPTASTFELPGAGLGSNNNGATYVAYLWTEIPGFSLFGSYTGNGSTDGPFVWCGFKPRLVLAKRIDSAASWAMLDSARSTFNVTDAYLIPDLSNAESSPNGNPFDLLSNGFKVRTSAGMNASGGTYIFAAFAETPFKFANAR